MDFVLDLKSLSVTICRLTMVRAPWFLTIVVHAAMAARNGIVAIKHLSASRADELKGTIFSGSCWVVACTDVEDRGSGKTLLESAAPLLEADGICSPASMKCHATLSSGKTVMARLGLKSPPSTYPLLFLAANGDAPRALALEDYATVQKGDGNKGASATPDKKVLAASAKRLGAPYKSFHVTSSESFSSRCVAHRHCLVVLTNSSSIKEASTSTAATRAVAALAESIASASRVVRVAVVDSATADFSLEKALPAVGPWPTGAGFHPYNAPRVLYLRSLTTKEKAAMSAPVAPPPAVLPGGTSLSKAPSVSRVSRTAIVSANAEAAAVAFEAKQVTPRQWAGLNASALKCEDLVFAIDGGYYSWAAAAPWLIGFSVFGSPPRDVDMKALGQKYPLVQPQVAKWAAKAYRGTFSQRALKEWAVEMTGVNAEVRNAALTPLPSAPRISIKKGAKDKSAQKKKKSTKTKAAPKKSNEGKEKAAESGAAARKRRLAEKAEALKQASREFEARQRMDAENEDLVPQSAEEAEEVEIGVDGEPLIWDQDEEDCDSDDENCEEAFEDDEILLL